jgi:hypothetical protein
MGRASCGIPDRISDAVEDVVVHGRRDVAAGSGFHAVPLPFVAGESDVVA